MSSATSQPGPADGDESLYAQAGGAPVFAALVEAFYARVVADPVLRPMFPDDLGPGKRAQLLFLTQYFGGPATYAAERGHPRLRMRHAPYKIDAEARDRWLAHMLAAIDEVGVAAPARDAMRDYFLKAAPFMMNVYGPPDALP